jgi:hypothetical protein
MQNSLKIYFSHFVMVQTLLKKKGKKFKILSSKTGTKPEILEEKLILKIH